MLNMPSRNQSIPPLFREIIKTDTAKRELQARPVVPLAEYGGLKREMDDFRRAAEQVLSWNRNKGNTA